MNRAGNPPAQFRRFVPAVQLNRRSRKPQYRTCVGKGGIQPIARQQPRQLLFDGRLQTRAAAGTQRDALHHQPLDVKPHVHHLNSDSLKGLLEFLHLGASGGKNELHADRLLTFGREESRVERDALDVGAGYVQARHTIEIQVLLGTCFGRSLLPDRLSLFRAPGTESSR